MHSFFVRRQLMLVIATVVVTAVLIALVFNMVAKSVFVRQKADEYAENVSRIAETHIAFTTGQISDVMYNQLLLGNIYNWDAKIAIFNAEGIPNTYSSDTVYDVLTGKTYRDPKPSEEHSVIVTLRPYVSQVLHGQTLASLGKGGLLRTGNIIVGTPAKDAEGNIIAAVFMTRPIKELDTALGSFNFALILSICGVLLVMLLPTYIGAALLARPIHQMRDVSLRMARGDFTARANTNVRGEIGELGGTLNYLSERLNYTIQELRLEKNRLSSIVDGLGEGIVAVDARGEITHINPALLRIFKPRAMSVGSWAHMQLIPDREIWEDFRATINARIPMTRNMHWEGKEFAVTISPLENDAGYPEGAVGLFRDITEQERLEQTRREYVANVSHELRTPVSSVRGLAEALNDGLIKTEEDRQRYYGFILRETMRLTRLIEDLLELSRLQSGAVALKKARVDMSELLMDFSERYAQVASDVNIEFHLDIPEPCPYALTNADRVEQVLVVLVDNAIKFTPSGGTITVGAREESGFLRLYVSDTGSGIEPEDLPHVFERFFKADRSHSGNGTGIGLSIAHEIVRLLGGELTVKSEVGRGSTFGFTVPVY